MWIVATLVGWWMTFYVAVVVGGEWPAMSRTLRACGVVIVVGAAAVAVACLLQTKAVNDAHVDRQVQACLADGGTPDINRGTVHCWHQGQP